MSFSVIKFILTYSLYSFVDQGLDFQLSFQTPTTEKDYILSPSPTTQHFEKLSVCLWVNTLAPGIFISYNTEDELGQSFTFGIDSNNFMLANVNGSLIKRLVMQ